MVQFYQFNFTYIYKIQVDFNIQKIANKTSLISNIDKKKFPIIYFKGAYSNRPFGSISTSVLASENFGN